MLCEHPRYMGVDPGLIELAEIKLVVADGHLGYINESLDKALTLP